MSPAQHVSQQTQHTKTKERIYVTVSSVFDATGYMQPTAITWADGPFLLRASATTTLLLFPPAVTAIRS